MRALAETVLRQNAGGLTRCAHLIHSEAGWQNSILADRPLLQQPCALGRVKQTGAASAAQSAGGQQS